MRTVIEVAVMGLLLMVVLLWGIVYLAIRHAFRHPGWLSRESIMLALTAVVIVAAHFTAQLGHHTLGWPYLNFMLLMPVIFASLTLLTVMAAAVLSRLKID
jgi:signal transduction histidine kinase